MCDVFYDIFRVCFL